MPIVIQNYRGFVPQEEKANGFETAGDKTLFFLFPPFFPPSPLISLLMKSLGTGAQNRVGLIFSR